jgi:G3E family GTPase
VQRKGKIMRTTVVTGLLGSGKTTFVRNFLRNRREKTVVLVNDFGQAGIDGEIISAGGIETIELPSGCVCCTLKFDLITSIQRAVKQFAPDHLLIEPSGVASPSGVLEALASAGLPPPSVVGIVDAVEFAELFGSGMYGSFFREQIESSDAVLVNKTDIAGEDAIAAAERLIAAINPRAVLFRTKNALLEHPLPAIARTDAGSVGREVHPPPLRERIEVKGGLPGHEGLCSFETLSFKLRTGSPLAALRNLFEGLVRNEYGTVVRAKALVATDQGPYRFDLVFGKIDVVRFEKDVSDSRLVVIGSGLRSDDLGNALP